MAWQFASGEILTAANLDAVTKPWNALAQVRMSTPQSLTNNTLTTLLFNTEDLDPLAWHSTGVNTGRITPTIAGWYRPTVNTNFVADTDYTVIQIVFTRNGSSSLVPVRQINGSNSGGSGNVPAALLTSTIVLLNGTTDYMEVQARQVNTSANANTVDASFLLELVYPT